VLIDFLFELRKRKLGVSTHEWMALMEAMALGLHESSLDGFYHLCRTICVKDIAHYDAYDEAFLAYFKDVHVASLELTKQLQEWLLDPKALEGLTDEQRQALQALDLERIYPAHGPVIENAQAKLTEYIEHRMLRERQILEALGDGLATIPAMVERIYRDVPVALHPMAAQSVASHLKKLARERRVRENPQGSAPSRWELL